MDASMGQAFSLQHISHRRSTSETVHSNFTRPLDVDLPLRTTYHPALANGGGPNSSLFLFWSTSFSQATDLGEASKPCSPAPASLTTHAVHAVFPVLLRVVLWC